VRTAKLTIFLIMTAILASCGMDPLTADDSPDKSKSAIAYTYRFGNSNTYVSVYDKANNNKISIMKLHGTVPVSFKWSNDKELIVYIPNKSLIENLSTNTGNLKIDVLEEKTTLIADASRLSLLEQQQLKTKQKREYLSPDNKYRAIVVPLPKASYGSGESKIEIHSKDAVVSSVSYSSEDGEHGFGVERAAWSPDSKFFVYNMSSSGGHQAWHFPTYFVSVSDFKTRYLDDYVGSITQPEFTFTPPDRIQVYGHTPSDFEKETEIKASLSKLLKK
jgi:hypothetical protein